MATTDTEPAPATTSSDDAESLAASLLGESRTRLGGLQIDHARRVAAGVRAHGDEQLVAAAFLHDVIEKGRISSEELLARTGDPVLVALVEVMTRRDDQKIDDYLAACAADPRALLLKRLDLMDKLDARTDDVQGEAIERVRAKAARRLADLERLATRTSSPEDAAPNLTADQLAEMLALIPGVDTVELKLSVPDRDRASAVRALELDPLEAQIRQIAFFDTPGLDLEAAGLIVRARRVQGKPGDTVVKLRPIDPATLTDDLRALAGFGVEVDAMPGAFVCSGRMKEEVDAAVVKALFAGRTTLPDVLTADQRALFDAHAPNGIRVEDLVMLGPINVLKLKLEPVELGRRLVAELWIYPDGSRLLELSTKCTPDEAFLVVARAKAYLAARGINLTAEQQTKTKTALKMLSNELVTVVI